MNTHICIRPGCGASYQSEDVEVYYCPEHLAEKNRIAEEITRKVGVGRNFEGMTPLQQYDASMDGHGFIRGTLS